MHVLALSFSSSTAATAGMVKLLPVDFNLKSYKFAMSKPEVINSFGVSIHRVILGVSVNTLLTILAAYPLLQGEERFLNAQLLCMVFLYNDFVQWWINSLVYDDSGSGSARQYMGADHSRCCTDI